MKSESGLSAQSYQTRRNLFLHILRQVRTYFPEQDKELTQYRRTFEKETSGRWKASQLDRLLDQIEKARIVYMADFHALQQSQKSQLRILRALPNKSKKILAVECFFKKDQEKIDRYIDGQISEREFLQSIEWKRTWGFSWQHYRPIFRWAQKTKTKIIGLNVAGKPSLRDRDLFAANIIGQTLGKHPEHQVFVIYGEWHLCSSHIPQLVKKRYKETGRQDKKLNTLTVLQNDDASYFALLKKGLSDNVDVLEKKDKQMFCIQSVPPWVKWQSYLVHLESDSGDSPFEDIDYTDEVGKFLSLIESDLNIKVDHSGLAVSTDRDAVVFRKISMLKDSKLQKWLQSLIENEVSFFCPEIELAYLARPSVNHCSALAMSFLGAKLSKRKDSLYRQPQEFLQLIWLETLNYFGSKIVNPKRKTDTIHDIKVSLLANQPKDRGRQALRIALAQKMKENLVLLGQSGGHSLGHSKTSALPKLQNVSYYREAARILGGMLGEKLYVGFRQGQFSLNVYHKWIKQSFESASFVSFYYSMIETLEVLPDTFQSKRDRL